MLPSTMKHLPLLALRAFEAAARTGSFRAAADDMQLTPSAVSHAMRGLERSLGVQLFTRQGRTIRLTAPGEILMRSVRRSFDELQHGIRAISTRGPPLLRLHSAPSFAAQWLVPRLPRFLAESHGQEVRIAASTNYTLFTHDEFDIEVFYGDPWGSGHAPGRHANLVVLPLGQETVTPLCAPALLTEIRTPRDLLSQTLIESDNKQVRWPAWFAANDLAAPEPRGPRFDRSFLSLSAAADGLGVALESTRLAERELASGRLVRPLGGACEDVTYTGHWLVFPRSNHYDKELVAFTRWLLGELGIPGGPFGNG